MSNLLELGDEDASLLHEELRDDGEMSSLSEDMKGEFDIKNLNFSSGYFAQYLKLKSKVEGKCVQLYMFLDQCIDRIPFRKIEEYLIKLFSFLKENLPQDNLFYGIMGLILIVFIILMSESSPKVK